MKSIPQLCQRMATEQTGKKDKHKEEMRMRKSFRVRYWEEREYRRTLEHAVIALLAINAAAVAAMVWAAWEIWNIMMI